MKKYICTVCGYVHIGIEPPMICIQCGAPHDQFREVTDLDELTEEERRERRERFRFWDNIPNERVTTSAEYTLKDLSTGKDVGTWKSVSTCKTKARQIIRKEAGLK